MTQVKVYTKKEIVFLIQDAIARTKATPGKEIGDIKPLLSAYYWEYGDTELKEYAFCLLEQLTKAQLLTLEGVSASLSKQQIIELIQVQARTKTKSWIKKEIIPQLEMSINAFESIFGISTANRRRLQEMKGVLPIARWGSTKYGDYPVLELKQMLAIVKAMPEILTKIKDYANEHLSRQAKEKAQEKARQMAFKERCDLAIAQLAPELQNQQIKTLIAQEQYKHAFNLIEQVIKQEERRTRDKAIQLSFQSEYHKAIESLAPEYQYIIQTTSVLKLVEQGHFRTAIDEVNRLIREQEKAKKKQRKNTPNQQDKVLFASPATVNRFLTWLNTEDVQLFTDDGEVVTFCDRILVDEEIHHLCTTILNAQNLAALTQKRWKYKLTGQSAQQLIETLEDAIFAHPMFLQESDELSVINSVATPV